VNDKLQAIFRETYSELRASSSVPEIRIEFFQFANLNNTIRLREGRLLVRLSDLLEGAPETVLRALAHILLAKMYRKPIERTHANRYRRYVHSHEIRDKAHVVRQMRGRKHIASPTGRVYDLEELFESLNTRFFGGLLARPRLTWSLTHSRNRLGHYDPAHNTIVISRVFDHPAVPRYAAEYIVYHEMLHLKHPVKLRGSRRCVHSREFVKDEKLFPELEAAQRFMKRM
jgi:predicted metal-dependent hydrolase